jgi:hypothetical protein
MRLLDLAVFLDLFSQAVAALRRFEASHRNVIGRLAGGIDGGIPQRYQLISQGFASPTFTEGRRGG